MNKHMKYLYYLFVLFTVILRRLVFPLIYIAIPFRAKLNNIVFNCHLQNGIKLKRLEERTPTRITDGWSLDNRHSETKGFIEYSKVSKLKYYLALPLWLLLDADSMADTYDAGFNKTIVSGQRKKWIPQFIKNKLQEAIWKEESCPIVGNTFDLGDSRAGCPLFSFWSVFWWTLRNPAYNFNYKFNQMAQNGKEFKIVIFGRLFGWNEDGTVDGVQYYSWEFGRKL